MLKVLVVGCGYLGSRICEELHQDGIPVWGLKTSPTTSERPYQMIYGDLFEESLKQKIPSDINTIVYAIAARRYDQSSYRQAYVDGMRICLSFALPVSRLIFISSTAVYGQISGEAVTEDSKTEPIDFSGKTLLQAEGLLESFSKENCKSYILRSSGIYGPGRCRTLEQARQEVVRLQKYPPLYMNMIHVADLARASVNFIKNDFDVGKYIISDSLPAQKYEVYSWVRELLKLSPILESSESITPQRGNKRCLNRKLLSTGFVLKYPTYKEGLASLL